MLSKIIPHVKLKNDINMIPVDKTAVGKRGTNPVSKKVITIGYAKKSDKQNRNKEITPKKNSGLVSFSNLMILNKILNPSLNVLSLLCELGGRSKYFESISAHGMESVNA